MREQRSTVLGPTEGSFKPKEIFCSKRMDERSVRSSRPHNNGGDGLSEISYGPTSTNELRGLEGAGNRYIESKQEVTKNFKESPYSTGVTVLHVLVCNELYYYRRNNRRIKKTGNERVRRSKRTLVEDLFKRKLRN